MYYISRHVNRRVYILPQVTVLRKLEHMHFFGIFVVAATSRSTTFVRHVDPPNNHSRAYVLKQDRAGGGGVGWKKTKQQAQQLRRLLRFEQPRMRSQRVGGAPRATTATVARQPLGARNSPTGASPDTAARRKGHGLDRPPSLHSDSQALRPS